MRRKQKLLLFTGFVAVSTTLGYWLIRPLKPQEMEIDQVRRIDVRFEPWCESMVCLPGGQTEDRDVIAAVIAVVRSAQETSDHKCGSRGVVTFRQSVGLPTELRFLPGHDPEWYEFRAWGKVYRVPRVEFVSAMRLVGVQVPLECE